MLDELPDLEEMQNNSFDHNADPKYQKFIRNFSNELPNQAGMSMSMPSHGAPPPSNYHQMIMSPPPYGPPPSDFRNYPPPPGPPPPPLPGYGEYSFNSGPYTPISEEINRMKNIPGVRVIQGKPTNYVSYVGPGVMNEEYFQETQHSTQPAPQKNKKIEKEDYVRKPNVENFDSGPTCIAVADHILMCPICSKFYNKSGDKNILLIFIAFLCALLVIAVKKIFDKTA